jgi:hypothetical protein
LNQFLLDDCFAFNHGETVTHSFKLTLDRQEKWKGKEGLAQENKPIESWRSQLGAAKYKVKIVRN